jgi:transposase-like protein
MVEKEQSTNLPAVRLAQLTAPELARVLDNAIESYGSGASIYAIANDLGVEHTTLYRHLVKHREEEWRDAKVGRALAELEEAEEALKTAPDGLALSRARERCRAAQWQLERLMRRIYGQDAPAKVGAAIQININTRGAAPQSGTTVEITDVSKSNVLETP